MPRDTDIFRTADAPAHSLDPAACVFRHVARTSRAVTSIYDATFAPLDLTAGQFDLMMTLHQAGPQTVGNLAKLAAMDASTVPRAIRPLLDRDMIVVRQGEDRRQRIVALTAIGRRRVRRAAAAWEKAQCAVIKEFGEADWRAMMRDLARLRAVVRGRKSAAAGRRRNGSG
ncbi:MAG: winged helix-turn-helix transcriptional regulator [Proteobacteria bacterium]|nr:winged helix-turn-helix transcriptional regulator [Pseudomonadota bacterium]